MSMFGSGGKPYNEGIPTSVVAHIIIARGSYGILGKVLKFAKKFSTPTKSLENRDKVWKNGKKSGIFFKASASAFPVVKSNSFHVLEKSLKKS